MFHIYYTVIIKYDLRWIIDNKQHYAAYGASTHRTIVYFLMHSAYF